MKFFEDFKIDKTSKIGITNLLSNITTRPGSHKGGWSRLLKCQLKNMGYENVKVLDNKDSILEYGIIIFDLGAEFSGGLNLFGGLDEKVFKRLSEIEAYKGQLFSWKHNLPEVTSLEGRRTNSSTCESFKSTRLEFLGSVQQVLESTQTFDHAYRTPNLLIGDSHTPSVWTPEYMIERRDGRTLAGMLEHQTLKRYVGQFPELKSILVHCSSIDIRHHAARSDEPQSYVLKLSQELIRQLTELNIPFNIVETMGIEDESRELPKTGYYKGTAFYGSWEVRNKLRTVFNGSLNLWLNGKQIQFPKYFFDEVGKLRMDVMEVPQSVHLSPEHYRWNLDTNTARW